MSGTTSSPVPTQVCGAFFYDNTPTVAAALDLQTAVTAASNIIALGYLNGFLTNNLESLPNSPAGLASGQPWNNGGVISIVR